MNKYDAYEDIQSNLPLNRQKGGKLIGYPHTHSIYIYMTLLYIVFVVVGVMMYELLAGRPPWQVGS
eukprot:COSAG06_NODE_1321_length_9872_cov_11.153177_6_plen_66_part_00